MKGKTQAQRRKERDDFVKANARQIQEFMAHGWGVTQQRQVAGLKHFVNIYVRQALGYKKSTNWEDIWYTIRRDFHRVFPEQIIFGPIPAGDPLADAQKKILVLEDALKGFVTAVRNNFDYPKYYLPMRKAEKLIS